MQNHFRYARRSQMPQDNIKLIVKQIFFDPAVRDYKTGNTIKIRVVVSLRITPQQKLNPPQDRIRLSHIGIPKNLEETNPQGWVEIEAKVGYEVTQLRGAIKKVVSLTPCCPMPHSIANRMV